MSATREDIDRLKLCRTDPIDFYNYLVNVKYGRKPPRAALRNALCDFYDAAWQIGKESSLPKRRDRSKAAPSAPGGDYVLVPREPTPKMLVEGVRAKVRGSPLWIHFADHGMNAHDLIPVYHAMLSAAPLGKTCEQGMVPNELEAAIDQARRDK